MPAWVRYSIATYIGLLVAGSLVIPERKVSANDINLPAAEPIPCSMLDTPCTRCDAPASRDPADN